MMKKIQRSLPVIFSIVAIFFFSGICSADTKPIKLKLFSHSPPMSEEGQVFTQFIERFEAQSQERVKVRFFPAQSLVKQKDTWTALVNGIGDITMLLTCWEQDRFPLNNAHVLMPVQVAADERGSLFWKDLWEKFPEMKAEFDEVKVLAKWLYPPAALHMTRKEVRTPADLRGLKIIVPQQFIEFVKTADSTPLSVNGPEWFSALERGLGDGLMMTFRATGSMGALEPVQYHTNISLGYGAAVVVMNKKAFAKLPADIRKLLDEELGPWLEKAQMLAACKGDAEKAETAKKMGHAFYTPSPEEMKQWVALGMPEAKAWIAEMQAKGKPVEGIFEEAMRIAPQYR